jgi:hypothetical protein
MDSTIKLAKTLYKTPALVSHRVRCGRSNCRCADGLGHGPYAFLHWREGPIQRRRYIRREDVNAVRAVIADRQLHDREARRVLNEHRVWLAVVHAMIRGLRDE